MTAPSLRTLFWLYLVAFRSIHTFVFSDRCSFLACASFVLSLALGELVAGLRVYICTCFVKQRILSGGHKNTEPFTTYHTLITYLGSLLA